MKVYVVITTYLTSRQPCFKETIYDHPTEIEGEFETLSRCLKSLTIVKGEFQTIVISVPTRNSLANIVEKKVDSIVKPFQEKLNIKVLHPSTLLKLKRRLKILGFKNFSNYLSLKGYGNARNLCILIPYLDGADAVILVDDDEIVVDENFLKKPLELLGKTWENKQIFGLAGYYMYKETGYKLKEPENPWFLVWNKASLMNQTFKIIDLPGRFKPTNFVFGGCMAIHRRLIENVCFDPWITRGEDIDYLLCSKIYGFKFLLDNQWNILHEPPPKKRGFWGEFEQDVYRFIYQREKLKFLEKKLGKKILDESLDPFPGYFLKEDLEGKILVTGILYHLNQHLNELLKTKNLRQTYKIFRIVDLLLAKAKKYALKNRQKYYGFRKLWVKTVKKLRGKVKPF